MKKFLAFLLLSIFLYNQVGYFISFRMEQNEVRKKIKRRVKNSVPQGELTVIKIGNHNRHQVQWVKDGKEFMFNDGLFDVVRYEANGDEIIYYCINDTQEKQLFVQLDEHVRKHMDTNGTDHKHVQKNIVKEYFEAIVPQSLFIPFQISHFHSCTEPAVAGFGKNFLPPPEQA